MTDIFTSEWRAECLIYWLIVCLAINRLTEWLIWLVDWLIDCLTDLSILHLRTFISNGSWLVTETGQISLVMVTVYCLLYQNLYFFLYSTVRDNLVAPPAQLFSKIDERNYSYCFKGSGVVYLHLLWIEPCTTGATLSYQMSFLITAGITCRFLWNRHRFLSLAVCGFLPNCGEIGQ